MLSADEAVYAGAVVNSENSSVFIKKDSEYSLGTPSHEEIDSMRPFFITSSGKLSTYTGLSTDANYLNVAPVINLKSVIKISGGTGSKTNPYIISLN